MRPAIPDCASWIQRVRGVLTSATPLHTHCCPQRHHAVFEMHRYLEADSSQPLLPGCSFSPRCSITTQRPQHCCYHMPQPHYF